MERIKKPGQTPAQTPTASSSLDNFGPSLETPSRHPDVAHGAQHERLPFLAEAPNRPDLTSVPRPKPFAFELREKAGTGSEAKDWLETTEKKQGYFSQAVEAVGHVVFSIAKVFSGALFPRDEKEDFDLPDSEANAGLEDSIPLTSAEAGQDSPQQQPRLHELYEASLPKLDNVEEPTADKRQDYLKRSIEDFLKEPSRGKSPSSSESQFIHQDTRGPTFNIENHASTKARDLSADRLKRSLDNLEKEAFNSQVPSSSQGEQEGRNQMVLLSREQGKALLDKVREFHDNPSTDARVAKLQQAIRETWEELKDTRDGNKYSQRLLKSLQQLIFETDELLVAIEIQNIEEEETRLLRQRKETQASRPAPTAVESTEDEGLPLMPAQQLGLFLRWYQGLNEIERDAVDERVRDLRQGRLGDAHALKDGLAELKFTNGLRIYYSIQKGQVYLINGGNKDSLTKQDADIERARKILKDDILKRTDSTEDNRDR